MDLQHFTIRLSTNATTLPPRIQITRHNTELRLRLTPTRSEPIHLLTYLTRRRIQTDGLFRYRTANGTKVEYQVLYLDGRTHSIVWLSFYPYYPPDGPIFVAPADQGRSKLWQGTKQLKIYAQCAQYGEIGELPYVVLDNHQGRQQPQAQAAGNVPPGNGPAGLAPQGPPGQNGPGLHQPGGPQQPNFGGAPDQPAPVQQQPQPRPQPQQQQPVDLNPILDALNDLRNGQEVIVDVITQDRQERNQQEQRREAQRFENRVFEERMRRQQEGLGVAALQRENERLRREHEGLARRFHGRGERYWRGEEGWEW